jgi:hypothetical protein
MTDFFAEGGGTMFPTALFGLLAVTASLLLAARPERRFLPLLLSLSAPGFLGTMWGLTGVVKAAANAAAADVQTIVAACATQALNSLLLACVFVVLAMLGASSGALRGAMGRPVSG